MTMGGKTKRNMTCFCILMNFSKIVMIRADYVVFLLFLCVKMVVFAGLDKWSCVCFNLEDENFVSWYVTKFENFCYI